MNIRTPCSFATALFFSGIASAINIGEIASQSKLGELLYIQVELKTENTENVTPSCLSLVPPDSEDEDRQYYLTFPKLSVKTEAGRQYIVISSYDSFNEAFAKLKLRVSCPGMGSMTKTLTFLPDLNTVPTATANAAPIALALSPTLLELAAPEAARPVPPPARPRIAAEQSSWSKSARHQAKKRSSVPPSARKKPARPQTFRLKLSSEPMDESRIGKISDEERELLLARQKMLDADDQMASFLTLQNQVKLLQDELGEIKLKLAQLSASAPPAAASLANIKESSPPSPDVKSNRVVLFTAGLVLAILGLLFGLRLYNRINAQRLGEQAWKPVGEPVTPVFKPAAPRTNQTPQSAPAPARAVRPATSAIKNKSAPPPPPSYTKSQEELAEVDSIIEEAELYATYGHPERAALILQEVVAQHPNKTEAWMLLLSILSSLKKRAEFEKTAQDFLRHHPDSALWSDIQALGRTVERGHPLYDDGSIAETAPAAPTVTPSKRRLIGDILVEAGVLSLHEMEKCLDDFDPKQHGRLGGYLLERKLVTPEQLQDALRQQQMANAATEDPQPDSPPPPSYMENFLSGLNPQRDERLDEYKKMDHARSNKPKKT